MIVNHYTKTTMANTITMEINILRKEMNDLIIESNELAKQGIDLQYKIDNCGNYFDEKQIVPQARFALKHLKTAMDDERGTRRYLYTLFPYGYGQQACKIAGMRKPLKLMLDV